MALSRILGPDGQFIDLRQLEEDVDLGGLTSVRQVWHESVARGLTPAQLAGVLERSAQGDADDYLTLAEEMEERDAHYAAVLSVRKRAVVGLPRLVEAASESADHVKHADFVRQVIRRPATTELVADLTDGIGKGYSVCSIRWLRQAQWTPGEYPHMDPRWFRYDRDTGRELRLLDPSHTDGMPLQPFAYVVHQPRIKTGLQIRAGLARLCAFMFLCKSYALKDWVAFAEVFGMPLRIGRYGPHANNEDKAVLRRALSSIGTDAAAMLSDSLKMEFHQLGNVTGGADLYETLCTFADKQISKAVLGQTGTTDTEPGGIGSGFAEVKNEIRGDILAADAFDLEVTLNRDLVRPLVDLNFGPQVEYPRLILQITEPEDVKGIADYLKVMVPLGLEVEEKWARDKIGAPEPAKGAKLLRSPMAAPAALNHHVALNAAQRAQDATPGQVERVSREADAPLDGWIDAARRLLDQVQSLEEYRDGLLALHAQMPTADFQALLGDALTAAELAGRYDILAEAGQVR